MGYIVPSASLVGSSRHHNSFVANSRVPVTKEADMSDAGNVAGEFENLKADIARMSERLALLEGQDHTGDTTPRLRPAAPLAGPELTVGDTTETVVAQPVSRRGALLALSGVAASGVGLAVGSTLIGAAPAAAAPAPGASVFLLSMPIRVLDTRESGFPINANSGLVLTIGGVPSMASRFPRLQRASSAMRQSRHLPLTVSSVSMPHRKQLFRQSRTSTSNPAMWPGRTSAWS
jgi:hypothetical protein